MGVGYEKNFSVRFLSASIACAGNPDARFFAHDPERNPHWKKLQGASCSVGGCVVDDDYLNRVLAAVARNNGSNRPGQSPSFVARRNHDADERRIRDICGANGAHKPRSARSFAAKRLSTSANFSVRIKSFLVKRPRFFAFKGWDSR